MRRVIVAVLSLALALAFALPATAAAPSPQRMAGQIKTLQKQVKALQKTVKTLRTTVRQTQTLALVAVIYGACSNAVTADALQGGNPTAYGTTPVNDYGACNDLSQVTQTTIARQQGRATVSVFQSLLDIFKP